MAETDGPIKDKKFDQKAMDRIADKVLAFRPKKDKGKGRDANRLSTAGK